MFVGVIVDVVAHFIWVLHLVTCEMLKHISSMCYLMVAAGLFCERECVWINYSSKPIQCGEWVSYKSNWLSVGSFYLVLLGDGETC
jgi:hypothetical protein